VYIGNRQWVDVHVLGDDGLGWAGRILVYSAAAFAVHLCDVYKSWGRGGADVVVWPHRGVGFWTLVVFEVFLRTDTASVICEVVPLAFKHVVKGEALDVA
jgi:hypothetical protein